MMHRIHFLLSAILVSLSLITGCARSGTDADVVLANEMAVTPGASANDNTLNGADTVYLTVYGMSCPLCATNVDKQLLRVPGVERVQVDMSTGIVTIDIDPASPPDAADLKHAVEESGFTLAAGPSASPPR